MCGVAALLCPPGVDVEAGAIEAMTRAVAHRGPDGDGLARLAGPAGWRVELGHRRLKILDLSDAARQPMRYREHLWITYNGEVYNYLELRRELERLGHRFRSASDTEVVLAAYDEWGTGAFARLRGMWGLVLVDERAGRAVLARDRLGIKPLYLARTGKGAIAVCSELKQLHAVPGLELAPERAAVRAYLLTGYEDPRRTFFAGATPVPAATFQTVDLATGALSPPEPYWFPERVRASVRDPDEAARRFRAAFDEAVRLHLRSDVPVGCALSGGLDSSAIAAVVRRGGGELETFSATFPGHAVDERAHIDRVVAHVGARPHFVSPTAEGFLEDFDHFLRSHDEPVGSLSQYAGYAVARLTREAGVPVTLNGQGGDEVLSGYWECFLVHLRGAPLELCRHLWGAVLPGGNPELLRQLPVAYRRYRSQRAPSLALRGPADDDFTGPAARVVDMSPAERRVYDVRELSLPRLLKWDDRNFMAFSVEGRYPFLDHELIETCLGFDATALYRRGWTKEPLRRGLAGLLPDTILRRRGKVGFETPQAWLRGPLRVGFDALLAGDSPAWTYVEPAEARRQGPERQFRVLVLDRWLRQHFG